MEAKLASSPAGSKAGSPGPRLVKVVSETVRERETFKYDPFLVADLRINRTGRPLPPSETRTSSDSTLTALAQIGTYRTGAELAYISLFDANFQYIVAEATPSTPLTPCLPGHECPTPLRLCGSAIPRYHGICEYVLHADVATDSKQSTSVVDLPIFMVPDLTADHRFSSKPYCKSGQSPQFYAAVPIRTSRGINIGTYSVRSSKPIPWNDKCARTLREISQAIMDHLETNRSRCAYRRNERVNRGLGSFIEGKSTLSGWHHGPNVAAFVDKATHEGHLDATQQRLENHEHALKDGLPTPHLMDSIVSRIEADDTSLPLSKQAVRSPSVSFFDTARESRSRLVAPRSMDAIDGEMVENSKSRIFSRAANIIREAFEVEGCLFFDVTVGSYRAPTVQTPRRDAGVDGAPGQLSTSSSDEQLPISPSELPDASCDLLGFSTSARSSINTVEFTQDETALSKSFLAKLLRRYPEGKIFDFDAVGELQSSDSSEDERQANGLVNDPPSAPHHQPVTATHPTTRPTRISRPSRRTQEGALIHQTFPNARSVAFIPVWDSKRERWFAGGFVYTFSTTRVFSDHGELSLLKVFTRLISSEIHNLETLQDNEAKSDALGSLSHELRSPLHGVILGTELLNDTDLTVFQGNATHTIETCCRTLLDTIDHLLDYAKVNSFVAQHKQASNTTPPRLRKRASSDQFGTKRLYVHARLDGLVEEVVQSVFAGYNFQHMSVRQLTSQCASKKPVDTAAHQWMDSTQAMEQLGPKINGKGGSEDPHKLEFGSVSVYLLIDPSCNWMFHLPCGAIRRIVMNLFGNSLKFTSRGSIWVSLTQETLTQKRSRDDRIINITVQDTGKGISRDYIQHRLFKPFAQEDELAPGTGLGLSLVKKIVSTLQGQISVESQLGIGTKVTVALPLVQSGPKMELLDDDRHFVDRVRELSGLRVRLAGFSTEERPPRSELAIMQQICRDSLHLDVISEEQSQQLAPDMVIWLESALPKSPEELLGLAKNPSVIICQDALAAYERHRACERAGQSGIFEVISQPVGPRKLAKSIQLAYKRWMGLPKPFSLPSRPPGPPRVASSNGSPVGRESASSESSRDSQSPLRAARTPNAVVSEVHNGTPQEPASDLAQSQCLPLPKRILLVDDNPINLKMLSAFMSKLGRAYAAAVNGKEAVDTYLCDPGQYAGIIMDISMPVMDGFEATRRIRQFEAQNQVVPPVAILALTGLASKTAQQEALESGVDVFLTKPVRFKMLSGVLESMDILPPREGGDERVMTPV